MRDEKPALTVDANRAAAEKSPFLKNDHHFCIRTDVEYCFLTEDGQPVEFDLVLSFEHLEHIGHSKLDVFFEHLLRHTRKGTIIVATAADGGHTPNHSLFPKEWWVDFMTKKGFRELDVPSVLDERKRPFNCCNYGTHELIFEVA